MNFGRPCTQEEFGLLVGITQQAVSDLIVRGVLGRGQVALTWLHAYTGHLRDLAQSRGADGELAMRRAAESATRTQLLQIKLAKARAEFVEVDVINAVLAAVGRQLASSFDELPAAIARAVPALNDASIEEIQRAVTEVRAIAHGVSLRVLDSIDPDADESEKVTAV